MGEYINIMYVCQNLQIKKKEQTNDTGTDVPVSLHQQLKTRRFRCNLHLHNRQRLPLSNRRRLANLHIGPS